MSVSSGSGWELSVLFLLPGAVGGGAVGGNVWGAPMLAVVVVAIWAHLFSLLLSLGRGEKKSHVAPLVVAEGRGAVRAGQSLSLFFVWAAEAILFKFYSIQSLMRFHIYKYLFCL